MLNNWILTTNTYEPSRHLGTAPINTLGNGLIGCRGFFEEEQAGIAALGGIYIAGVFGRGSYTPWKGKGRELVNTPNFFYLHLKVDGDTVSLHSHQHSHFNSSLNMKEGIFTRSYIWHGPKGQKVHFEFERFISYSNIYKAGQKLRITPIDCTPSIEVFMGINTDVTNLNEVSCEPLPIQPGKRQYTTSYQDADSVKVHIAEPEDIILAESQSIEVSSFSCPTLQHTVNDKGHLFSYIGTENTSFELRKIVNIATSLETTGDPLSKVSEMLQDNSSYSQELILHKKAWAQKWDVADIHIDGCDKDQLALRYNIFQLIQACPEHSSHYSIGARGLTGEMYEGCVFWDTEIFMLPFFSFTNPIAASKLLEFRYHTLPESKLHAQSNYFKGAMYGWQVSAEGIEQTPLGVGAYYSIHVIADIAYAILEYWYATGDNNFMLEYGCEILIETARYWESRVSTNPDTGNYDILAVRGPNEYDVLVNNNLYTNMMARENLKLALKFIEIMKHTYQDAWQHLRSKLSFDDNECVTWLSIIDKITLPYDAIQDLYLEDDAYHRRVPVDMKVVKPTAKRIIDTTIPYEALPLYQITKQADVLHVMKNLPWEFSTEQIRKAWEFYVPKTAFDSSLAYSMHALMAARLGLLDKAHHYFDLSANLDIRDVQLNTISGLHFANFGGTWQAALFGFGGVSITPDFLEISPNLPTTWHTMRFKFYYKQGLFSVIIENKTLKVQTLIAPTTPAQFKIVGNSIQLAELTDCYTCSLN